jgi:hypothetical protein
VAAANRRAGTPVRRKQHGIMATEIATEANAMAAMISYRYSTRYEASHASVQYGAQSALDSS